jgi:DNA-binding transcriptional LysR family regulator
VTADFPPALPADLRHLQAFVAAAETGSMSAAAARLHVSQQALSRTVAALEQRVGAQLFERLPRGLTLTAAGEALLAPAERALEAAGEAFAVVREAAGSRAAAPLRADISSGGIETGALIIRRLRREHPGIPIELSEVGMARGIDLLGTGELDVLLGLAVAHPPAIRREAVRHERVLVGAAADHPIAAHSTVAVSALEGVPLLLPADRAAAEWTAFIEDHLRSAGVMPTRHPDITHGSVAAAEIVREGQCVVPTMAWTEPPDDLVFPALDAPPAVMTWSMMWRDGTEQRRPVRAFLAAARALAAERRWLSA